MFRYLDPIFPTCFLSFFSFPPLEVWPFPVVKRTLCVGESTGYVSSAVSSPQTHCWSDPDMFLYLLHHTSHWKPTFSPLPVNAHKSSQKKCCIRHFSANALDPEKWPHSMSKSAKVSLGLLGFSMMHNACVSQFGRISVLRLTQLLFFFFFTFFTLQLSFSTLTRAVWAEVDMFVSVFLIKMHVRAGCVKSCQAAAADFASGSSEICEGLSAVCVCGSLCWCTLVVKASRLQMWSDGRWFVGCSRDSNRESDCLLVHHWMVVSRKPMEECMRCGYTSKKKS